MKEIVWVFGNSAAGKETFIQRLVAGAEDQLNTALGWDKKTITACAASISHIGQFEDDPVTVRREDILTEVPELLQQSDVVLIKWQTADSESGRFERLMNLIPKAKHRIIQLIVDDVELEKRLPNKSWWSDDDVRAFISEEKAATQAIIHNYKDQVEITTIQWGLTGYSIV